MQKPSLCLLRVAALTAWAATAFAQTSTMLTLQVKNPEGAAVQNADVTIQSAQPQDPARVWVQGRLVNKSGMTFVIKTDANGQAQANEAGLKRAFPAGDVVVRVRAAGYAPYQQNLELADQKSLEIVLRPLPPK